MASEEQLYCGMGTVGCGMGTVGCGMGTVGCFGVGVVWGQLVCIIINR